MVPLYSDLLAYMPGALFVSLRFHNVELAMQDTVAISSYVSKRNTVSNTYTSR